MFPEVYLRTEGGYPETQQCPRYTKEVHIWMMPATDFKWFRCVG